MTNGDKTLPIRISGWFGGTTRFYAFVFTAAGIVLAFIGKLSVQYIALVGAIQALVLAHSMGQDYHERACNGNGNGVSHPAV